MFDPGGFKGRLRTCPFLRTRHALLCGKVHVKALEKAAAFFGRKGIDLQERDIRIVYTVRIEVNRCFSAAAGLNISSHRGRLEAT